ncbi:toprim domain-containing protein [Streptomyces coeruleoprunus]|uniref:Toprim domain-containing protein n=1 Tax=Streptomyces coeruleoprunus TaxID=285563 RepID=A0ABV9XJ66_9ACTN
MQTLSAAQRTYFEQAASIYQQDLAGDTSALAYLAKRGFGPSVVSTFRLGVVRRPLVGHEGYRGRLAIPYITPAGVVNMRFRCLRSHDCRAANCPKYLSQDGLTANLYNVLDLKKDSDHIGITEGELDAIALSISGIPAVGVPGVENWQQHFSRCLSDFDTVYSFADGDTAGRKFGKFLAKEAKARIVRVPQGEDINSLYVKGGPDAVRALIDG